MQQKNKHLKIEGCPFVVKLFYNCPFIPNVIKEDVCFTPSFIFGIVLIFISFFNELNSKHFKKCKLTTVESDIIHYISHDVIVCEHSFADA